MRCANTEALDAYLGEQDSQQDFTDKQIEIEDAILDCDGVEPIECRAKGLCDPDEWAEIVAAIRKHRASGKRGSAHDFQPDSCWWEHVHGVLDDRTSEHD